MEKQEVITVKDGVLYQFHFERIDYKDGYSDIGVSQGRPVGYSFRQSHPLVEQEALHFVVYVSGHVWAVKFNHQINDDMDRKAVTLGLEQIGQIEHHGSVILDSTAFNSLEARDSLSGTALRHSILRFLMVVSRNRPTETVDEKSVLYNVSGDTEEVCQHLTYLSEKGWLFCNSDTSKVIDSTRVHYERVYRLNPQKEAEVDDYIEKNETQTSVVPDGPLRAFISYSNEDKKIAGKIKSYLEKHGVTAFLAHDNIKVSKEWESEIRKELHECDIFVPLLTDNFRPSKWTDQEAGFAVGLDKTVFPLMVKDIPHGFLERIQAIKLDVSNVERACEKIIAVIREDEKLGPLLSKSQPKQAT